MAKINPYRDTSEQVIAPIKKDYSFFEDVGLAFDRESRSGTLTSLIQDYASSVKENGIDDVFFGEDMSVEELETEYPGVEWKEPVKKGLASAAYRRKVDEAIIDSKIEAGEEPGIVSNFIGASAAHMTDLPELAIAWAAGIGFGAAFGASKIASGFTGKLVKNVVEGLAPEVALIPARLGFGDEYNPSDVVKQTVGTIVGLNVGLRVGGKVGGKIIDFGKDTVLSRIKNKEKILVNEIADEVVPEKIKEMDVDTYSQVSDGAVLKAVKGEPIDVDRISLENRSDLEFMKSNKKQIKDQQKIEVYNEKTGDIEKEIDEMTKEAVVLKEKNPSLDSDLSVNKINLKEAFSTLVKCYFE